MRKILFILAISLVLACGLAMQAMAFTITNVNAPYSATVQGDNVKEEYGAADGSTVFSLVPTSILGFQSSDGNAVLNLSGVGATFFTKLLTFDDPNDIRNNFTITWQVDNNSPFFWSDYHLFFDPAAPINDSPPNAPSSANFKGVDSDFSTFIAFFFDPPGGKLIPPFGQPSNQLEFTFSLDTSGFQVGDSIEVIQIATSTGEAPPVPIPGSLLLLGSGVLGLIGLRWKL